MKQKPCDLNNQESDGTDISRFDYVLEAAGLRRTMSISGSAYTSADIVYDYDAAYQLTKETRTGGSAFAQSFWYDSAGNRTKLLVDSTTTAYQYDYIDRMTKDGGNTRLWDEWGNMTKVNSHYYSWNDSDRMTKFDHATGTSNDATHHYLPGTGKRYKRVQDTTAEYFIFDGDNVLASYGSGGALNASYLTPGLDANLSMTNTTDTYYYMVDGLGSVGNLVDSSETVQNTYDYRAFGVNQGMTENAANPYHFTARARNCIFTVNC